MKHVVHFGGGKTSSEQALFRNYLKNYENIIENHHYGAFVNSVFKESNETIEPNLADTIKKWVEDGLSIITFFGHSSAQGFEVSLDDPQFYDNEKKYPLIIANGCFSGDMHIPITNAGIQLPSQSEKFVLTEKAGAIGFIAPGVLSYDQLLYQYTETLYKKIAKDNYENTLGHCMQACAKQLINDNQNPSSFQLRDIILTMNLHGDPAVKLNNHLQPDYYIDKHQIYFEPEEISVDLNSFDMNIIIHNLGKATDENFKLYIERIVFWYKYFFTGKRK